MLGSETHPEGGGSVNSKRIVAAALLLLLLCSAAALLAQKVLFPQKPPDSMTSFLAAAEEVSVNLSQVLDSESEEELILSLSGASLNFEKLCWYAPLLQNRYGYGEEGAKDLPLQQTIQQNCDAFQAIATGCLAGDPLTEEDRQTLSRLQADLEAMLEAFRQEDGQFDPNACEDAYVFQVLSDYANAAA